MSTSQISCRIPQVYAPAFDRALSTLMIGVRPFPSTSHAAYLDHYFACGGRSLHLHGEGGEEISRQVAGQWMGERHNREQMFLCSQICHEGWNEDIQTEFERLTPEYIAEDISQDLRLLQTDYLDLVYLSRDDSDVPVSTLLEALTAERQQGRIRAFGVRNWNAARIHAANNYAQEHSIPGFAALITTELSLGSPNTPLWEGYAPFGAELQACVQHWNMAVFAWISDFNQPLFVPGKVQPEERANARMVDRWYSPANFATLERAKEWGQCRNLDERQVNAAFILNQEFPVVGILIQEETSDVSLERYIEAAQVRLEPSERTLLAG